MPTFCERRPRLPAPVAVAAPLALPCASTPGATSSANVSPVVVAALTSASSESGAGFVSFFLAIISHNRPGPRSSQNLLRCLSLPFTDDSLNAGQRLLLFTNALDCIHLAQSQFEI